MFSARFEKRLLLQQFLGLDPGAAQSASTERMALKRHATPGVPSETHRWPDRSKEGIGASKDRRLQATMMCPYAAATMDRSEQDVVALARTFATQISAIPYGDFSPHRERDEIIIARTLLLLGSLLSVGKADDPHRERALRVLGLAPE